MCNVLCSTALVLCACVAVTDYLLVYNTLAAESACPSVFYTGLVGQLMYMGVCGHVNCNVLRIGVC